MQFLLGKHFPLVHGCERLHPRFRRPLGAGDEGKNTRGDTIFVSLSIEHQLQRFFEFFFRRQRLVSVQQEILGMYSQRTQILLGEGHEFFLLIRQYAVKNI